MTDSPRRATAPRISKICLTGRDRSSSHRETRPRLLGRLSLRVPSDSFVTRDQEE
jgi:hypothetical protein